MRTPGVNECVLNRDICHAEANCSNTVGSFTCQCKTGNAGDGATCNDANECLAGSPLCSGDADCIKVGSYECV